MNILRKERGQFPHVDVAYLPKPCLHCEDPPCVRAGGGAVRRRPDGIVLVDPEAARGRVDLKTACPYGAIWWNDEAGLPQKCTFCAHLLDRGWKAPRCVQACPTGALTVHRVEAGGRRAFVERQGLEPLLPADAGKGFGVYYRNLFRFRSAFIAGSVAAEVDGVSECAEGATVTLWQGSRRLARQAADLFGDFAFDGLAPGSGPYRIEVERAGSAPAAVEVNLGASRSLGTIRLEPAVGAG
jgi:Fe-S-cluster-containing dehydrogenase component